MNEKNQLAKSNESQAVQGRSDEAQRRITVVPAVDVYEDSNGVTLWADLPGVTKDTLDVSVRDGSLYIEGEAVVPTPPALRVQHAEISAPHFARAFSLAKEFDLSKIEANLQDGVLKLTIHRHEAARPRRIEVKAA